MLPAIWPEDTLIVERVLPDDILPGQVVVVGRHGTLCAHRVVAVKGKENNRHWITQGDALPDPDPPVFASELMGRVAYVVRAGRLIPIPAALTFFQGMTATIIRHAVPAARAMVFAHRILRFSRKLNSKEISCPQ